MIVEPEDFRTQVPPYRNPPAPPPSQEPKQGG